MLADIPTIRLDFVAWLCARLGLSCQTVACTRERPLPAFPSADVECVAERMGGIGRHDQDTAAGRGFRHSARRGARRLADAAFAAEKQELWRANFR